jgi:hypothetical protein
MFPNTAVFPSPDVSQLARSGQSGYIRRTMMRLGHFYSYFFGFPAVGGTSLERVQP